MDKERKFPLVLSSFWLKVIALLTMTLDHVGYLMPAYNMNHTVETIFRIIGRIALPLFCFMVAEGVVHTKSFKKYALRLGIMASVVSVIILFSDLIPFFKNNGLSMRYEGIIFLDLLLGALSVYLLKQKKWYIKLLAILPFVYGVASFIAADFDYCGCYGKILWFPYFMRTQYGWYGMLLIVAFYFAHFITKLIVKSISQNMQIPYDMYEGSNLERLVLNTVSIIFLVVLTFLYYWAKLLLPVPHTSDYSIQLFAIIAGVFILLYNGYRGYNKKWFQYGSYLYYLLHLPIVYLIVYLISLI